MRLGALLFFLIVAAACSAEPTGKQSLPVCEQGTANCPSVPKAGKKPPKESGPSGTPETPTDVPPPPEKVADAGPSKDAEVPLGTLCTALSKCCADLEAAGYPPETCKGIVDLKNENACYAQHEQYKQYGDCS
jgi:hypothetical protein